MEVEGPGRARSDALAKFSEWLSIMPFLFSLQGNETKTTQHETSRRRPDRVQRRVFYSTSCFDYIFFCSSEGTETLRPQLYQSTRHSIMDSPHKRASRLASSPRQLSCPHVENHPSPGKPVRLISRCIPQHKRVHGELGDRSEISRPSA